MSRDFRVKLITITREFAVSRDFRVKLITMTREFAVSRDFRVKLIPMTRSMVLTRAKRMSRGDRHSMVNTLDTSRAGRFSGLRNTCCNKYTFIVVGISLQNR